MVISRSSPNENYFAFIAYSLSLSLSEFLFSSCSYQFAREKLSFTIEALDPRKSSLADKDREIGDFRQQSGLFGRSLLVCTTDPLCTGPACSPSVSHYEPHHGEAMNGEQFKECRSAHEHRLPLRMLSMTEKVRILFLEQKSKVFCKINSIF